MPLPTPQTKDVLQGLILITSGISVYLMAGKNHKRAFIVSLACQPLWFYITYNSGQWGMFILSIWHTINQVRGYINHRDEY